MCQRLVRLGEVGARQAQQLRLSQVSESAMAGTLRQATRTQSSFSDTPASSSSCRCFSTIWSSHWKSRTTYLRRKRSSALSAAATVQCLAHLFSRHFCRNSSLTFLKTVTFTSANSSSAAILLQACHAASAREHSVGNRLHAPGRTRHHHARQPLVLGLPVLQIVPVTKRQQVLSHNWRTAQSGASWKHSSCADSTRWLAPGPPGSTHLGTATSSVSRYSDPRSAKSSLCTTSASDFTERLPLRRDKRQHASKRADRPLSLLRCRLSSHRSTHVFLRCSCCNWPLARL